MIELLVVIAVLALLIGLVTAVGSKVIGQQKVRATQQIMQNATLALEQFSTEDPLRAIYDLKDRQTFGKYPPYQLANALTPNSVSLALEPGHAYSGSPPNIPSLADRLARDLSGSSNPDRDLWVSIPPDLSGPDGNDDNRALYAYLKVYSPESLRLVPEERIKPIYPQLPRTGRSYMNSCGFGAAPGNNGVEDILGIHDAWGVPLDYMLYVKCEYQLRPGGTSPVWVITERRPVLRSRGIEREVYDAWVQSDPADPTQRLATLSPADKWIFSEELPKPWAGLTDGPDYLTGLLPPNPSTSNSANGWSRAVGVGEDYGYLPADRD
jgi:type II secretory pathway pseudopilin PulG